MKRITQNLVIIYFVAFISLPLGLMAVGYEAPAVENKDISDFPSFDSDRILDTTFYADFAVALRERMPARPQGIAAKARVDLAFGDSPNPQVAIGSDGWLYLAETVEVECISEDDARLVADRIRFIQEAYERAQRRLLFVVAPDKAAVYPQYLGKLAENTCIAANVVRWEEAFAGLEPDVVLLWDDMAEASADSQIYHQKDTHWNARGAAVAGEAVVENLRPGVWGSGERDFSGVSSFDADLTVLMGLPTRISAPVVSIERPGVVSTVQAGRLDIPAAPIVRASATASPESPLVPGKTAVLHDSFGGAFVETVLQDFEALTAIGSFDLGYETVLSEVRGADALVVMTVERELLARLTGANWTRFLLPLIDATELINPGELLSGAQGSVRLNEVSLLETGGGRPMIFPQVTVVDDRRQFLAVTGVANEATVIDAFWTNDGSFSRDRSVGIRFPAGASYTVLLDLSDASAGSAVRVDLGSNMVVEAVRILDF